MHKGLEFEQLVILQAGGLGLNPRYSGETFIRTTSYFRLIYLLFYWFIL